MTNEYKEEINSPATVPNVFDALNSTNIREIWDHALILVETCDDQYNNWHCEISAMEDGCLSAILQWRSGDPREGLLSLECWADALKLAHDERARQQPASWEMLRAGMRTRILNYGTGRTLETNDQYDAEAARVYAHFQHEEWKEVGYAA